nr:hypothetical protein [Tanacetum cinerariifolium]
MNKGFLDLGGGNNNNIKKTNADASNSSFIESDGTRNDANLLKDVILPSVEESVAMEVHSTLVKQTKAVKSGGESYLPLPTKGTTMGNRDDVVVPVESIRVVSHMFANLAYGFFLGKRVAYPVVANYVRNMWGKFGLSSNYSQKEEPICEFIKEDVGSVPVWVKLHGVPVTTFSEDGLSAIATKLDTPIMLDSYTIDMCLQSWGRLSYARVMIELRGFVELKDTIMVDMPKINLEGFYTCTVRLSVRAGKIKKKKSSQAPKVIPVGPRMAFKPNQEYRHVPKKNTANSSGSKKKGMDSTNKVSDSNPFEVLNSVDNDVEIAILVDEAGNPLKKAEYLDDNDSEDEVASDDNDMARSLASERT